MNESSREKLDMDLGEFCGNNRSNNKQTMSSSNQLSSSVSFNQRKGLFIPRWLLLLFSILFIAGIVLCAIFLLFFLPCSHHLSSSPLHDDLSLSDSGLRKTPAARLPTSLVPTSYAISLQPFIGPDKFIFDGNVTIIIQAREATDKITLHFNNLTIFNETVQLEPVTSSLSTSSAAESISTDSESLRRRRRDVISEDESLMDQSAEQFEGDNYNERVKRTVDSVVSKRIPIKSFEIQDDNDFYIINLEQSLRPGYSYKLSMRFLGNLNKDLAGFYRSSYNDTVTNQQRWIATTQFEPTDARRAFPCFDEPALKSIFNITLIHLNNMTAISNMPIVEKLERGDWTITRFDSTVNMSTYLLAFVVGNIESDVVQEANRSFAVWGRPGTKDSRKFALEIGPKILQHYEKFFGIDYPLPKTDMVAVPDFNAGAMENWGIIIYRETTMLFDPKSGSILSKKRVADVVAHELAHQWFGNLVTPKWWDDLWLNEGFATYMEYEGVDSIYPEWRAHDVFVTEEIQVVFELDCLATSHPISVKVSDPDEINEIFDRISYEKGASLIRMMRYTLGDKVFREGVSSYLKALAYSNAEQNDLWHYLTLAQNSSNGETIPVKKVMDSWTLQVGFPLVTLTRTYGNGNGTSPSGRLSQERFLISLNSSIEKKERWEIPISLTTKAAPNWDPLPQFWIHSEEVEKTMDNSMLPGDDEWVIINLQEVGYYKVNYDERNWKLLIDQLQKDHTQIHVLNRAQIVDDLLDLARANVVNYSLALEVTKYLVNEDDFIPWGSAGSGLKFLDSMLRRSSLYGRWRNYVLSLIVDKYNTYQWRAPNNPDDIASQTMQLRMIGWACFYQHMPCIREAQNQFESWRIAKSVNSTNPIHPNLRGDVVCVAVQWGTEKEWQWVWEQYKSAESASEKEYLMRGLACTREPWLLTRYLEMSLDDSSGIRKQDGSTVFRSVASSEYGRDIAFNYFRNKWDKIVSYYGKSYFAFGNLVRSVASSITIDFELDQFKSFYVKVKNDLGTAQRAFKQAIEKAEANVAWMNQNYQEIEAWLNKQEIKIN